MVKHSEKQRIKESQERFYQKFKNIFGIGRHVPQSDVVIFEALKESNRSLREALFGHPDKTWYYDMESAIDRFDNRAN